MTHWVQLIPHAHHVAGVVQQLWWDITHWHGTFIPWTPSR